MIKQVSISISSPEEIWHESSGEVVKAETINYRTYRPEPDGLFCERIFGTTKNYECYCGKYKKKRYKGIVCNTCGVKITTPNARRKRLGHITLASPLIHIWFFRCFPSKLATLLQLQAEDVEQIIYAEKYILLDKGDFENQLFFIKNLELISLRLYKKINKLIKRTKPINKPIITTGAKAFELMFNKLNIHILDKDLREEQQIFPSNFQKDSLNYRLKTIREILDGKETYKNIVLKLIPVIPPEIRPLVQLDTGKYATSDLNELYRKLIIRNNRLKKFTQIRVPQIIIRNERRLLQESVDSLFDNSKKIIPITSENNRVIKSLSDGLKGKLGIFRFNLLGKRVDYSARSVIISGPKLKLYECGLPRQMLIELFRPYILNKILAHGQTINLKEAQKIISNNKKIIWKLLNHLIYKYPILLNRAPTLHKLGIQCFYPKITEEKAIELHPLVCAGFNADFDGDQMAVHIPLSKEAILEAKCLMLPTQNILNPANGNPILVPSQDMLLGLYYLSKEIKNKEHPRRTFSNTKEVQIAYNNNIIDINHHILVRMKQQLVSTTAGKVLFNLLIPKAVGYYNKLLTKSSLSKLIKEIYVKTNSYQTIKFLDNIKDIGFDISFKAGLSLNLDDLTIPYIKKQILEQALKTNQQINRNNKTEDNELKYQTNIKFWSQINNQLTHHLITYLKTSKNGFNPIYMMLNSGARSSIEQIRQISGMRGLMAKPKNKIDSKHIIEKPIFSNFIEGLSNYEYFISTHGARKGLADTALKTADAGYLTRRLVDVAQDVVITETDCKTLLGIYVTQLIINNQLIESLEERVLGRISLQNIYDKNRQRLLITQDELIDEQRAHLIKESNIKQIQVRSPITCQAKQGICIKCYGINLSTGLRAQKGDAVGILAAQSIGEPGTQLTLRTFHIGGTAGNVAESKNFLSNYNGTIKYQHIKAITTKTYQRVISHQATLKLYLLNSKIRLKIKIPYGSQLFITNNQTLKKGDLIYKWDPHYYPIISELNAKVIWNNLDQDVTLRQQQIQTGQEVKRVPNKIHNSRIPYLGLIIKDNNQITCKKYTLPTGSQILVNNLEETKAGQLIAKIPRRCFNSTDITGGLPRVSELLETIKPLHSALISEVKGRVKYGRIKRNKQALLIQTHQGRPQRYHLNIDQQILVNENEPIKAGNKLSEGERALNEMLTIQGIYAFHKYLINEIQAVYRLEGVKIADKHFEIIIRQMLKKVQIIHSGDTNLLAGNIVDKDILDSENKQLSTFKIITFNAKPKLGLLVGDKINNNNLKRRTNNEELKTREPRPAIGRPILLGITKSALQNKSFLSAASFQETTKILSESALRRQTDPLKGIKENVLLGNPIPAGTGFNSQP
ncbi:DNA-directed RNA polymerase subunit beta' [Candidatus Karelsulcia muelleri]